MEKIKMRSYEITWIDCYCEEHNDLILLPETLPQKILTKLARRTVEEYANGTFNNIKTISSKTYETVIAKMDIMQEGNGNG